ncbi:MAG: hypothetical protein Q9214_007186, partial [Letrouitia sp. 1 TL-2023]
MANLQACSSFGDIVWFGVGVQHILRVLVQTSQGSSLVALCVALSEGFTQPTSALIINEIAQLCGSPQDLSPSFSQWEALIRVSSCALTNSTFGLRFHQMLKLGGYTQNQVKSDHTGHPKDIAEVILAVGSVASGDIQEIRIRGGPTCSWVATFADYLLGLRVMVRSQDESLIFANFNNQEINAQIIVYFANDLPLEGLGCVGRVFYIRQGYDFVQQCFHRSYVDSFHLGGRVEFKSMLQETFGWCAAALISPRAQSWWPGSDFSPFQKLDDLFVNLYMAGAAFYVSWTAEKCRYQGSTDFLHSAFAWIPELRQNEAKLLETARHHDAKRPERQEIVDTYNAARAGIRSQCACQDCSGNSKGPTVATQ